jgi:tetratricopeptide (TPR) repeat protein
MKSQGFRDLETHSLTVDNRAQSACERAKELEYRGEYERARQALKAYWPRIGVRPRIADLGASSAAEVLMRSGVLTGIIGSQQQIADAQETAKNLISESLTIFESSGDGKKIAEAQTELALSYWRTGEFNEARDLLEDALSQPALDTDVKAKAVLRLAIVEHQARESHKALHILTSHAE